MYSKIVDLLSVSHIIADLRVIFGKYVVIAVATIYLYG